MGYYTQHEGLLATRSEHMDTLKKLLESEGVDFIEGEGELDIDYAECKAYGLIRKLAAFAKEHGLHGAIECIGEENNDRYDIVCAGPDVFVQRYEMTPTGKPQKVEANNG